MIPGSPRSTAKPKHRANYPTVSTPTDYIGKHRAQPKPVPMKYGRR